MVPGIEYSTSEWLLRDAILAHQIKEGDLCAIPELIDRRTSLTEEQAEELPFSVVADVLEDIVAALKQGERESDPAMSAESAIEEVLDLFRQFDRDS